jgi:hypothetical protein
MPMISLRTVRNAYRAVYEASLIRKKSRLSVVLVIVQNLEP